MEGELCKLSEIVAVWKKYKVIFVSFGVTDGSDWVLGDN